jgi:hypothetical protein
VAEQLPASLQAALADFARWLEEAQIPATIVGGIAASILGRPRLTRDIDALAILPEEEWAKAAQSAARYGIVPRIDDALGFARRSRVLLMRHVASGIDLDLIFGGLPFERSAVEQSITRDVDGVLIRLPRVEHLLIMKAVAGRPKDLEDIRGLLDANSEADVAEARRWVREFATATGMPRMLEELDKLLGRRPRGS